MFKSKTRSHILIHSLCGQSDHTMNGLKLIQSQVVIVHAKLEAKSYKSYSSNINLSNTRAQHDNV